MPNVMNDLTQGSMESYMELMKGVRWRERERQRKKIKERRKTNNKLCCTCKYTMSNFTRKTKQNNAKKYLAELCQILKHSTI